MERARGTANMQAQLAQSQVTIDIAANAAQAREAEARGQAAYVELTGRAEATKVEAVGLAEAAAVKALGLARAAGFEAQTQALGQLPTAIVAVANAVSDGHITVVPEVLVTGGNGGGAFEGLAATLMRTFGSGNGSGNGAAKPAIVVPEPGGTVVADSEPGETVVVDEEPEAKS
jgi:uncharacterized membrane protein YqiK